MKVYIQPICIYTSRFHVWKLSRYGSGKAAHRAFYNYLPAILLSMPKGWPRGERRYEFAYTTALIPSPNQRYIHEPWLPAVMEYLVGEGFIPLTEIPQGVNGEDAEAYDVAIAFKMRGHGLLPPYRSPHLWLNDEGGVELVVPWNYRHEALWHLLATELSAIAATETEREERKASRWEEIENLYDRKPHRRPHVRSRPGHMPNRARRELGIDAAA